KSLPPDAFHHRKKSMPRRALGRDTSAFAAERDRAPASRRCIAPRPFPIHLVKQPSFFSPGSFNVRILFLASQLPIPARQDGGASVRHPHLPTSPQVTPGYIKRFIFCPCTTLTAPLRSSGYIISNRDRSQGSRHARLEQAFGPPSYGAFVVRAATPMAATSF